MAYEEIIGFIRRQQAELGFTQPQYWMLRHLSKNHLEFIAAVILPHV
ncbi:MAG: MarR family transcriptional regulator [Sphaerisporangium sp.]|nr:MarR family transcriptional regulator [Sphaerisporangium sp.]